MSEPILVAFCSSSDRERVRAVRCDAVWHDSATALVVEGLPGLILLAIGPDGGAALARWVGEHGLDGVRGIGLIGVTAPWAVHGVCEHCAGLAARWTSMCGSHPIPLGPLEPLRAVAERALRADEPCLECHGSGTIIARDGVTGSPCGCDGNQAPPLFILACTQDDGVCAGCGGQCFVCAAPGFPGFERRCDACSSTGRALSSARVAEELVGEPVERTRIGSTHPQVFTSGGSSAILYPTRAALDEHGLRALVERLTR